MLKINQYEFKACGGGGGGGEGTFVVRPRPPGEDLEQCQVLCVLLRVAQILDVRCLQQLGEDVCVWCARGLHHQVGGGAGRSCGLAEGQKRLQRIEGFCLLHLELRVAELRN